MIGNKSCNLMWIVSSIVDDFWSVSITVSEQQCSSGCPQWIASQVNYIAQQQQPPSVRPNIRLVHGNLVSSNWRKFLIFQNEPGDKKRFLKWSNDTGHNWNQFAMKPSMSGCNSKRLNELLTTFLHSNLNLRVSRRMLIKNSICRRIKMPCMHS